MAKLSIAQIHTLRRINGGEIAQATQPEYVGWNCYGRWRDSGKSCKSIQPLLRMKLIEFHRGWPEKFVKGTYYRVVVSNKGIKYLRDNEDKT